jgi:Uma2 family endonuclease
MATWDEYLATIADPAYEKAKSYYFDGRMRIEMSPVSTRHSRDHAIVLAAVILYASLRNIDLDAQDNCTYRKAGCREVQPDVSFYIDETADSVPWDVGIIDLDIYPAPTLTIEVAYTSLSDDKGEKRLMYEAIGVAEYWIVDVQKAEVLAFAVENGGSRRITQSQVLPGLEIALLEEALQRSRRMNHGKVSAWLLTQFQAVADKV